MPGQDSPGLRIEYERACKQAGLPEEKIREIRKVFDADYKSWKREKKTRREAGFVDFSLDWLMNPDTDVCCFDIPDPEMDVERMILIL